MKKKDWVQAVVVTAVWYVFFYYLLYAIKGNNSLWLDALVLIVLATIGIVYCPWFQQTDGWKRLMKK